MISAAFDRKRLSDVIFGKDIARVAKLLPPGELKKGTVFTLLGEKEEDVFLFAT